MLLFFKRRNSFFGGFMETKRTAAVDRIEGEFIVCICDDNSEEIVLKKNDFPDLYESDVIEITFENNIPVSVTKSEEERKRRLAANKERLNRLFNRKK